MNEKRNWAKKFVDAKQKGKGNVQAAVAAGYSRSYAKNVSAKLAKRQEVIDELVRRGLHHPDDLVGEMSKGVLVEKLADYQSTTNRELAPFVQMGLQVGKKIGAGSVQQAPQTVNNTQIIVSPVDQDAFDRAMLELKRRHPEREILLHAGNQSNDEGVEAGEASQRLEEGSDSEKSASSFSDCAQLGTKEEVNEN